MKTDSITLFCGAQVSPNTAEVYGFQMRRFADWLQAEYRVKIEMATTAHVLAYKASVAHLKPATQARIVATVRAFYRWAREAGIIKSDPAVVVRPPRAIREQEPTYITTEETRRLIGNVDDYARHAQRDRVLLWVLAQGLRVSEVCGLNVGDVIPPKGTALPALRVRGKGSKARSVPIGSAAYAAIVTYLDERGDVVKDAPLLVCQSAGDDAKRLTPRSVRWLFAKYAERAGLDPDKWHPHAARHGFATRLLFETSTPGGIFTVSKLLGHGHISTTELYLHINRGQLDQAVIGDPLNGS
jgi:integrase/recombinase XerD